MSETVSDILGKGLKIENRVVIEFLPPEKLEGTIPAFIGGAHWGPTNTPTLVQKSFSDYFGDPVVAEDENDNRALDFSGQAADFHLNYSNLCYFTRITDGTDKVASRLLKKDAKVAKLIGSGAAQNTIATIFPEATSEAYQNNIFVIKDKNDVIKQIKIDGSSSAITEIDMSNFDGTTNADSTILVSIDDTMFSYKISSGDTQTDVVAGLVASIVSKLGVSTAIAQTMVYELTIEDIDLVDATFETDDVILIDSTYYQYDGTNWAEISVTSQIVAPTVDPADGAVYYSEDSGSESVEVFNDGTQSFDTNSVTVDVIGNRAVADGGQGYFYATDESILYNDTGSWVVITHTVIADTSELPTIYSADGYYWDSVGEKLYFYDNTLDSVTELTLTNQDFIILKSRNYGTTSRVQIHDFPGTEYDEDNTLDISGQDTSLNAVVADIQTALENVEAASDTEGLYVKATTWGEASNDTVGGSTVPTGPSDGDLWKNTEGVSGYDYGWYQYDSTDEVWNAIFIDFGTAKPEDVVGSDDDLFEVIADVAMTGITVSFDEYGRFMVITDDAGSTETFEILETAGNTSIYDTLFIESSDLDTEVAGTDEEMGGRIEAYYTGETGNEILLFATEDKNGEVLTITMGSSLIGTFYDYSYTVADENFIGDLINNDRVASKFVQLIVDTGATSIPNFELNQALYLSGGSSGLNNLLDFMYIAAANEYKNLDLYDVDIVCASGIISEDVVDAFTAISEYRKDCFVVTDPPQAMSPYSVEKWHNGESDLRTSKFDSEYVALYYPWVLIETSSANLPQQWAPPSVRVVGTIGNCDLLNQNIYTPPAGHKNAQIYQIEALERYLTEEDKQTLYADRLDNNINPLVYNKNNGYFIDGQKTTKRGRTPINRIKCVRTSLYIKRKIAEIAPNYFYMPINARTRAQFAGELTTLMANLAEASAVKDDFTVDVSEELNNEYVEADNGLIARIEWSPVKSVEKIKVINIIKDQQLQTSIEI